MGVGLEIDVEKLEKVISEAPVRPNEKQEAFIRHFVLDKIQTASQEAL